MAVRSSPDTESQYHQESFPERHPESLTVQNHSMQHSETVE